MKNLATRLLPAVQTPTRKVALAAAGIAVAGAGIAVPAVASASGGHPAAHPATAHAVAGKAAEGKAGEAKAAEAKADGNADGKAAAKSDAKPAAPAAKSDSKPAAKADAKAAETKPAAPDAKDLTVDYQPQSTYFYCAPASTRIAASAQGHTLSQDDIAGKLGTTQAGTPSAEDTTRVLNSINGNNDYHTTSVPDADPKRAATVQSDIVKAITSGRAVVANIRGAATDTAGNGHDFAGGHYLVVVGYADQGRTVHIADPADVNGADAYDLNTADLARWMATRGYSS
jgi:hypothetical protein